MSVCSYGNVLPCQLLRRLRPEELAVTNVAEAHKRWIFDKAIHQRLGNSYSLAPPQPDNKLLAKFEEVTSDDVLKEELPYLLPGEEGSPDIPVADLTDSAGNPIASALPTDRKSYTDTLIGVEVSLPRGDGKKGLCKILREAVDDKGRTIGEHNDNLEFQHHGLQVSMLGWC